MSARVATFSDTYIRDGLRSAFVERGGAFTNIAPADLGTRVATAVLAKLGFTPAGIGSTIHGGGLEILADAAALVSRGDADCVLAVAAGPTATAAGAEPRAVTREDADRYAARSFERAMVARHFIAGEIVSVASDSLITLPHGIKAVDSDTRLRATSFDTLSKLDGGVDTTGNTAPLTDGAAAMVIGRKRGTPLARLHASAIADDTATAIHALLDAASLTLDQIDRIEIHETSAASILATARALALDLAKLNVNGGAIALGHAPAATGIRLALTLARELVRSHTRWGIVSEHGSALLIENEDDA